MRIGALLVTLRIPENHSLKGKRRVVKSIVDQVAGRFNVSIAEIDNHDVWQTATLGVTCVSNDGRHANEVLSSIVTFLERTRGDAEIIDYEIEILHAL